MRHIFFCTMILAAVVLIVGVSIPVDTSSQEPVPDTQRKERTQHTPQEERKKDITQEAELAFVGDIQLDRYIRDVAHTQGGDHLFSCIREPLLERDVVIGNLEGPITSFPSKSIGTKPGNRYNTMFTFPTSTAALLARHNIRLVSLANNHSRDLGKEGVVQTRKYLLEEDIGFFGDPYARNVAYVTIKDADLAFVGYSAFGGSATRTVARIEQAHAHNRLPVVFAHWGKEYLSATDRMRKHARRFIDAGAVLVVGAHPHVVQEHETYKGTPIYYSLGNFIFDQYFSEDVRTGLMLEVDIGAAGVVDVRERSLTLMRDGRTCLSEDIAS